LPVVMKLMSPGDNMMSDNNSSCATNNHT
jgi:hypothetical protein